uniref:Uncharacterized protein n=1 Tax=Anguilla anguilla TaxID=7936 RepID=A0A0E9XMU4_ANGAN
MCDIRSNATWIPSILYDHAFVLVAVKQLKRLSDLYSFQRRSLENNDKTSI